MRTIEAIRLENYRRLLAEMERALGRGPKDAEIAKALGISTVYAWQIRKGKRQTIDSTAARKIEASQGKATGWMDTDFALWPFPGIEPDRFARLSAEQKLELQGLVRRSMIDFETPAVQQPGETGSSSFGLGAGQK